MKGIRVIIADDHAVVRAGLAALLDAEPDVAVVGQAKNGLEAVAKARELKPDVVIMDLRMPDMDGATATARLHRILPSVRVLILTSFGEADAVAHALAAGAAGAITKTAEDGELVEVVRKTAAGETYVSPDIRRCLHENPPIPHLTRARPKSSTTWRRASRTVTLPNCCTSALTASRSTSTASSRRSMPPTAQKPSPSRSASTC